MYLDSYISIYIKLCRHNFIYIYIVCVCVCLCPRPCRSSLGPVVSVNHPIFTWSFSYVIRWFMVLLCTTDGENTQGDRSEKQYCREVACSTSKAFNPLPCRMKPNNMEVLRALQHVFNRTDPNNRELLRALQHVFN